MTDVPGRLLSQVELALPLFLLVGVGYAAMRSLRWPASAADALTRFVFVVAIPALLFRLMADLSSLPPVDGRILVAFFGGCLVVFAVARVLAWLVLRLDGADQSAFGMAGVHTNIVMLSLPVAESALGPQALPAVAVVVALNAAVLWTLATLSVTVARAGRPSWGSLAAVGRELVTNPVVLSIVAGAAYGLTGWPLPGPVDSSLGLLADAAVPTALVALGMALVRYAVRPGWRVSLGIVATKLVVHPLVVWGLAVLIGLPELETQVAVLVASTATGVNTYLFARRFEVLEAPVAAALVLSTAVSALTMPAFLTLLGA